MKELVLLSHPVGPRNQAQTIMFGGKYLILDQGQTYLWAAET